MRARPSRDAPSKSGAAAATGRVGCAHSAVTQRAAGSPAAFFSCLPAGKVHPSPAAFVHLLAARLKAAAQHPLTS